MDQDHIFERPPDSPAAHVRDSLHELLRVDGFMLTSRIVSVSEHHVHELDLEKVIISTEPDGIISCELERPETDAMAYRREWYFILDSREVTSFKVAIEYTAEERVLLHDHHQNFEAWFDAARVLDEQGILSLDEAQDILNATLEKAIENMKALQCAIELGYLATSEDKAHNLNERIALMKQALDVAFLGSSESTTRSLFSVEANYQQSYRRLIETYGDIFTIRADIHKRAMKETAEHFNLVRSGMEGKLGSSQMWTLVAQLDKCRDF